MFPKASNLVLSLGANTAGSWGDPREALLRTHQWLLAHEFVIVKASSIFLTPPHTAAGMMPRFYNQVLLARSGHAPTALLRLIKSAENEAGRSRQARWTARPLDIDILDMGGRICNWPASTAPTAPLILPHPLMHKRGFVLVPLVEIAPWWHHPALDTTAGQLLHRQPRLRHGIAVA